MVINKRIEHTLLGPEVSGKQVATLLMEAIDCNFEAVCVNPTWVKTASNILAETPVKLCAFIGSYIGATTPETKVYEAEEALRGGAGELDLVINIGAIIDKNDGVVKDEITGVVGVAKGKALVKVLVGSEFLTNEEIVRACKLAVDCGADYVGNLGGNSKDSSIIKDVTLMRKVVGSNIGVKASGVRNLETMEKLFEIGISKIGTSRGFEIYREFNKKHSIEG